MTTRSFSDDFRTRIKGYGAGHAKAIAAATDSLIGSLPMPVRMGWLCPKCGGSNSPAMMVCGHCKPTLPPQVTYTTTK